MRRMRLIRCLKGYTLGDIGELLGVSGNYVRTFEREEVDFSLKHKKKIAKLLGVTVQELDSPITEEEKEKYFKSNGRFNAYRLTQKKHEEKPIEVIKNKIIKACENQACPLNKDCHCDNDVVKEDRGTCAGQNLVKAKPKNLGWSGTY